MPAWRTDPATRRGRRLSRRVMPPKRWSPRASRKLVGTSWPGTSMSVATNSISWRSTRVLRPRWSSSRCVGARVGSLACPRRRSITANDRGSGRRRTVSSIAGRCRTDRPCRDCRYGSTWSSSSLGGAFATTGTPCSRRGPDRLPSRPVLHSRPVRGLDPEPPEPNACATRRGAHTRTVPTGTVPAGPTALRPPATRSAEE